jgi:endo-1,4-beta-D-glucanase Y
MIGMLLMIIACLGRAQQPFYPFPQHVNYTAGTIIPNHLPQAQLDEATQAFYSQWKKRYIKAGCGVGRYYVFANADGTFDDPSTLTVSEAHGYGMVIVALMAGYDPQAKIIFDGLYRYYKDHPSGQNPYLMAWKQTKECKSTDGVDSATDGDLDIAYSLLLADKQWGSAGSINYYQEALRAINAIMDADINPRTFTILLGDWSSPDESNYYYGTRPSDFMMSHLKSYESATGDARWTKVTDATYNLIATIQTKYSPVTGLLPDFVENINTSPRPARGNYLEVPNDGSYYYNSCRAPLRIATDYLLSGDSRSLAAMNKINSWLRTKTGDNPLKIRAGYQLNGNNIRGNNYFELAFVAPLGVAAMVAENNQQWLNDIWDAIVSVPFAKGDYYGNSLKMLSIIVMSGNWWNMQSGWGSSWMFGGAD